jgi:c-di-GMP-binding flagellar brake protein YcgR
LIDISIHPKVKITRMHKMNENYMYGISFVDLTENDKVQIDEIVNYQCMVDDQTLGENCDEGSCLFIKNKRNH